MKKKRVYIKNDKENGFFLGGHFFVAPMSPHVAPNVISKKFLSIYFIFLKNR